MTTDEAVMKLQELRIEGVKENPLFGLSPMDEALSMAIEALKREPKTGNWIDIGHYHDADGNRIECYECSNCHTVCDDQTDFCLNCGADMRGSKK